MEQAQRFHQDDLVEPLRLVPPYRYFIDQGTAIWLEGAKYQGYHSAQPQTVCWKRWNKLKNIELAAAVKMVA